ncbi:Zinc finger-like protein [Plakobranchus ocellatus]|uniref:Zinc finger-like protein n=1 Tax=Plakobranchus ocellatus TaxID=259542 RepID=A0AAV4AGM3_9GAST|nr:Zinc finger-like protein [Plakobranchus ocellatus]
MITRSVFKPGQDSYECLSPWHHGITKRQTYSGKDRRRDTSSKSHHYLSLVTRFYLGLRMTRMRSSAAQKSQTSTNGRKTQRQAASQSVLIKAQTHEQSLAPYLANAPEKHRPESMLSVPNNQLILGKSTCSKGCTNPQNHGRPLTIEENVMILENQINKLPYTKPESKEWSKVHDMNKTFKMRNKWSHLLYKHNFHAKNSSMKNQCAVDDECKHQESRAFTDNGNIPTQKKESKNLNASTNTPCFVIWPEEKYQSSRTLGNGNRSKNLPLAIVQEKTSESDRGLKTITTVTAGETSSFCCGNLTLTALCQNCSECSACLPLHKTHSSSKTSLTSVVSTAMCLSDSKIGRYLPMTGSKRSTPGYADTNAVDCENITSSCDGYQDFLMFNDGKSISLAISKKRIDAIHGVSKEEGCEISQNLEALTDQEKRKSERNQDNNDYQLQIRNPSRKNSAKCKSHIQQGSPRLWNVTTTENIRTSFDKNSIRSADKLATSASYDSGNKAFVYSIPTKVEKRLACSETFCAATGSMTCNCTVLGNKTSAATKSRAKPRLKKQGNISAFQSLHKNQIMVATLGNHIPVFLTACEISEQTNVKETTYSLPNTHSNQSIFSRVPYAATKETYSTISGISKDNGNKQMPFEPDDKICSEGTAFSPPGTKNKTTAPIHFKDAANDKMRATIYDHSCKIEVNNDVSNKAHRFHSIPSILPFSNTYIAPYENHSAVKPFYFSTAIADPATLAAVSPKQRTNKTSSSSQTPDGPKHHHLTPTLFSPLQSTAGQALVFLSPSTSFNTPTATPTVTHSRGMLPNLCGDGKSQLPAFFIQHSRNDISDKDFAHQRKSPVFQKKTLSDSEKLISEKIMFTSAYQFPVPHFVSSAPLNYAGTSFASSSSLTNEGTNTLVTSAVSACTPTTLLFLKEHQQFSTPAFDLLSSVARSPSVSAGNTFRLQDSINSSAAHKNNSNFLSPLLQNLSPAPKKSLFNASTIYKLGTSPDKNNVGSVTALYNCYSSKDHGYNRVRPKRPKQHTSFAPVTPNLEVTTRNTVCASNTRINGEFLFFDVPPRLEETPGCSKGLKAINGSTTCKNYSIHSGKIPHHNSTLNTALAIPFNENSNKSIVDTCSNSSLATTYPFCEIASTQAIAVNTLSAVTGSTGSGVSVSTKPTRLDNMCPICCRLFTRSWLLKGHMRTHTGERPYLCPQPACQKAFADRSNLRSHMLTHTVVGKSFLCPRCGRTFSQKRYLHKHKTEVCKVNVNK